jgi:peptide/nickel transport system permease protein
VEKQKMAESTKREVIYQKEQIKRRSLWVDVFIRLVKEKPLGTIGGIIVLLFLLVGIFADLLAPYGYNEIDLVARLSPLSADHILGTDNLGRDMLSRIIYGARISMYVGLGATGIATLLSVAIGMTSGYYGGMYDSLMQRFVDAEMCLPPLFLYLSVMALVGPGMLQLIIVLGIATGIRQSRVVRSAVIGIKENAYVEAAEAIGSGTGRMLTHHILPNIMAPIIILFSITIGAMILMESTLSFLGFGIPPPTPSWGGMLSGSGRQYMLQAPWMAVWPGVALALVVWGMNMLGDGLRDIFDPRLRGGLGRYGRVKRKKPR